MRDDENDDVILKQFERDMEDFHELIGKPVFDFLISKRFWKGVLWLAVVLAMILLPYWWR